MKRRYFGTDGVRGPYGGPLLNDDFARRLGAAAARYFLAGGAAAGGVVLIGRDTRRSGSALAGAAAAGIGAEGLHPVDLGIVPTPAVARAVRSRGAAFGVVITASHNRAADNGIKIFGPDGTKLGEDDEARIEQWLETAPAQRAAAPGTFSPDDSARRDYIEAMAALLPPAALQGWTIALDTANGAATTTAPAVLRELGAEVKVVGGAPDGANINAGVGSEHPESVQTLVRHHGARVGVALDGDGDRCVLCDERGDILDGDEILTLLAVDALRQRRLAANMLVVTVQSNLGVDAAVTAAGGRVVRTPVGDRHVAERMRAEGARLGGESSGHIICADVATAGDGLVAALRVMEVMQRTGQPLSALRGALKKFPQLARVVTVQRKPPLETLPGLQAAIRQAEAGLGPRGRVMVRYSGTEPKIRLLAEGPEAAPVQRAIDSLEQAVRDELDR